MISNSLSGHILARIQALSKRFASSLAVQSVFTNHCKSTLPNKSVVDGLREVLLKDNSLGLILSISFSDLSRTVLVYHLAFDGH